MTVVAGRTGSAAVAMFFVVGCLGASNRGLGRWTSRKWASASASVGLVSVLVKVVNSVFPPKGRGQVADVSVNADPNTMSLVVVARQGITGIQSGDEIIQINKTK